ncbi:hypothetical protein, partial [Xanthovirga aplysinae]|uniref:hypothetical protein n=1 Tax=Xanthovirga aplysinae TaxID=2529853 RepID=UPI001CA3BA44
NESVLRKCFHALKGINSQRSNQVTDKLIKSKNPNIQTVMKMINKTQLPTMASCHVLPMEKPGIRMYGSQVNR